MAESVAVLKRDRATCVDELTWALAEFQSSDDPANASALIEKVKSVFSKYERAHLLLTARMDADDQSTETLKAEHDRLIKQVSDAVSSDDHNGLGSPRVSNPEQQQLERDVMSLQRDKEKAERELQLLQRALDDTKREHSRERQRLSEARSSPARSRHNSEGTEQLDAMTALFKQLIVNSNLPKPTLIEFNGNPTEFSKFMNSFYVNIESCVSDDRLRLNYLIQFCKGEAREAIESFVLMNPSEGYELAKRTLKERFGQPHMVARYYLDKLIRGSSVRSNDTKALELLVTEMQTCELTLKSLNYEDGLNNLETLRKLATRLPFHMRAKWSERVAAIIEDTGREPRFSDMLTFVKKQLRSSTTAFGYDLANDSRKSKSSDPSYKPFSKPQRPPLNVSKGRNFHATESYVCMCSRGCKDLSKCYKFKGANMSDRRAFIVKHRLCFKCFQAGHMAQKCDKNVICTLCNKNHNSLMHIFDESHTKVNVNCHKIEASGSQARVCLPIVPIQVKGLKNKWVDTYALLDTGSDISLCSQRLLDQLQFKGVQKSFSLTTVNNVNRVKQGREVYLQVRPYGSQCRPTQVSKVWSVSDIPVEMSALASDEEIRSWPHLAGVHIPKISHSTIEVLIGSDQSHILATSETRLGGSGKPSASKGILGWQVFGPCYKRGTHPNSVRSKGFVNFHQSLDPLMDNVNRMWTTEFSEVFDKDTKVNMSVEDKKALDIMDNSVVFKEGHYHIELPWRDEEVSLPNNYSTALHRLKSLKNRLSKDAKMLSSYTETVNKWVSTGQARKVSKQELEAPATGKEWFLPHHPVVNVHKPGKVRVVYDCAAKHEGKSLNMALLQGPLIMNSLLGVLLRFRQDSIAIAADVENMFHMVRVYEKDQKSLRFLWYPDGNLDAGPQVYCMNVHLFGATSSPSCASYALRRAASDQRDEFSAEAVSTVMLNFYVDDCLKAVSQPSEAAKLVSELRQLLANKGFRLTKWISNDRSVLESIPESERAASIKQVSLYEDDLPVDRTLGISWDVQSDSFQYNVSLPQKPKTRRGILSCIASFYDPAGYCSPTTLEAKLLLQDLCRLKLGWDDEIPAEYQVRWDQCVSELNKLQGFKVSRCFVPSDFGKVVRRELHVFGDASQMGYGCCVYLRSINDKGNVVVSLVMGKSRLAPIKVQTIVRLELGAALVACKVSRLVQEELEFKIDQVYYWSDSLIVLSYINNTTTRFKTYVANRIAAIHELSSPEQWRHIPGVINPADLASRGISTCDKQGLKVWVSGPAFLLKSEEHWPINRCSSEGQIDPEDTEIRKQVCNIKVGDSSFLHKVTDKYSSFHKMCRAVSWLIRYKQYCRQRYLKQNISVNSGELTVSEVQEAESSIIKLVQAEAFPQEVECLLKGKQISKGSTLSSLAPFVKDGILLLGGRLQAAKLDFETKHQIILPSRHNVTESLIVDKHVSIGHMASHSVLYQLRSKYWIIHGLSAVKHVLGKCITCKKLRARPCQQQMSELPEDRVRGEEPAFSTTGLDYFGNFQVQVGRKTYKRYGIVFTCLAIRAVHIEVTESLSTESFLMAFTRFCSIRGCPKRVYSDNGSSLVRGSKELKQMLMQWDHSKINKQMVKSGIEWHFGVPNASHQNGVFERVIRSIRGVLAGLVHQQVMTPEVLSTLFASCTYILNSRPITALSSDPNDFRALSPNSLLLFKHNVSFPMKEPSGQSYPIKRWAQLEYLTSLFWKRWTKEFISSLQSRQKWHHVKESVKVGDLVLVVDAQLPRFSWPMGRIVSVNEGRHGLVRSCTVKCANGSVLARPIHKLCMLEAAT